MIVNGDCREYIAGIVRASEHPVIVTDPPFNVGYHYDEYADKMGEGEYYEMLAEIFSLCPFVIIHYPEAIYRVAFQTGQFPERVVSWVYNSNTPRQHRDAAYFGIAPNFDGMGEYKNPTDKRIAQRIAEGKKGEGLRLDILRPSKECPEAERRASMPNAFVCHALRYRESPEKRDHNRSICGGGYDTSCRKEARKKLRWNRDFPNVLPTNQRQTFK